VYHLGKTNGSIALLCRNTTTFKGFVGQAFCRRAGRQTGLSFSPPKTTQPGADGLLAHMTARPPDDLFHLRLLAQFPRRVYTGFFGSPVMAAQIEQFDPMAPQREAALFYGLFLRGHSAESLRRDIDVPKKLIDKLLKRHRNEQQIQARLQRAYVYRKQVLAVFDELVTRERTRVQ